MKPTAASVFWRSLAALFTLTALPALGTEVNASSAPVKVTVIAPGLYPLSVAPGGNVGVAVGDGGVILIDTGFAELAPRIREALQVDFAGRRGRVSGEPLRGFDSTVSWPPGLARRGVVKGEAASHTMRASGRVPD